MNEIEESPEVMVRPKPKKADAEAKTKRQPPYNVILVNDNDHSYEYVIDLCRKLFGYAVEKGFEIATKVDKEGRAIIWTGTFEGAELKQELIHGFGADPALKRCKGSMTAEIEPVA